MGINVKSEIAPLKKVLIHRPGNELEQLTPDYLERLLFDDIPFLKAAQKEHDNFARILKENNIEPIYLVDLVTQTLNQDSDIKKKFIEEFIDQGGNIAINNKDELREFLSSIKDNRNLVLKSMSGVKINEVSSSKNPLARLVKQNSRFLLDPIPNLYFTRDPFAIIGNGVSINGMYSETRCRETIYGKYIFKYHPEYKDTPHFYDNNLPFHIEGGDILNLNEHVLAIGLSQRTCPEGLELLASNIFKSESSEINKIIAINIPNLRTFMHLDTVFTQVDTDKFLIHPGILKNLTTFELTPSKNDFKVRLLEEPLATTLAKAIGVDKVTFIQCGGLDMVVSEREQWNDGSNSLCISPGRVIVYDRNTVTNESLTHFNIETIEIPSSELSRGRGGPRCMSMPLIRQ